jgi:hypothetical protein
MAEVVREVLLALVGHVGGLFDFTEDGDLAPVKGVLEPSEAAAAARTASVGRQYEALNRFVASARGGAFERACANAISKALSSYRSTVISLEQEAINFPGDPPSLLRIESSLSPFRFAFPTVASTLNTSRTSHLLWHLHTSCCSSGSPSARHLLSSMLAHCNVELLEMIRSWAVFGVLCDPSGEFFITRDFDGHEVDAQNSDDINLKHSSEVEVSAFSSSAALSATSSNHRKRSNRPLEPASMDDPEARTDRKKLDTESDARLRRSSSGSKWRRPPAWSRKHRMDFRHHRIAADAIPPRLELETADAILFVGQALRILKQTENATRLGDVAGEEVQGSLEDSLDEIADSSFGELDAHALRQAIEPVRDSLAQRLWTVVVEQHNLKAKLSSLSNYFLAGRGDFLLSFLEESRNLLLLPPTASRSFSAAQASLESAFSQAGLKSGAINDPYFSCFMPRLLEGTDEESSILGHANSYAVPRLDGWDKLVLECDVEYPLSLLVNEQCLAKYQALHRYILQLKRVEFALEEVWALQQQRGGEASSATPTQPQISLRMAQHEMAFFIRNWLAYLLGDVIDPEHVSLHQKLHSLNDFRELVSEHERFLSAVVSKALLDTSEIVRELEAIIACCMRLHAIARGGSKLHREQHRRRTSTGFGSVDETSIKEAWFDFRQNVESLLSKLRSVPRGHHVREPSLASLLQRITFNDFFSTTSRR